MTVKRQTNVMRTMMFIIRLHAIIVLHIMCNGILCQPSSAAIPHRDDLPDLCDGKSSCKFCNDILKVKALCRMKDLCKKNRIPLQSIPKEKSLKNHISEKVCCSRNSTFNLHDFQCNEETFDMDKIMNSAVEILRNVDIRMEYKDAISMMMSKIGEAGKKDEQSFYHNVIGKMITNLLGNTFLGDLRLDKMSSSCLNAMKGQGDYQGCNIMKLILKLKAFIGGRSRKIDSECLKKSHFQKDCKENESFCILTGQCEDRKACLLFPLIEEDFKPAGERGKHADGIEVEENLRRNAHMQDGGGTLADEENISKRYVVRSDESKWEEAWYNTCEKLDSLCKRVESYEEEYKKICVTPSPEYKEKKSEYRRKNQPKPENHVQRKDQTPQRKYDGPVFISVTFNSSILDDVIKKGRKIKEFADSYNLFHSEGVTHEATIIKMVPPSIWKCENLEADSTLKEGDTLDMGKCALRWKDDDNRLLFASMDLKIQHPLEENRYLILSLIWKKSELSDGSNKAVAAKAFKGKAFKKSRNTKVVKLNGAFRHGKRRIRRNTANSQSSITFMTLDEIQSNLTAFTNDLFPVRYDNNANQRKVDFRAFIPIAKRSICSQMQNALNSSVVTNKIALYSQRISNFSTVGEVLTTFGETVTFGNGFSDIFGEFYVSSSSVKGDVFSSSENSAIQLLSNIFSIHLINSSANGLFNIIGTDNDTSSLDITMLQQDNITENAWCRIWNSTGWIYEGCFTERHGNKVVCRCNKFGHIGLFDVPPSHRINGSNSGNYNGTGNNWNGSNNSGGNNNNSGNNNSGNGSGNNTGNNGNSNTGNNINGTNNNGNNGNGSNSNNGNNGNGNNNNSGNNTNGTNNNSGNNMNGTNNNSGNNMNGTNNNSGNNMNGTNNNSGNNMNGTNNNSGNNMNGTNNNSGNNINGTNNNSGNNMNGTNNNNGNNNTGNNMNGGNNTNGNNANGTDGSNGSSGGGNGSNNSTSGTSGGNEDGESPDGPSSITSKDCQLTYEGDFDATVAYFNNSLDNAKSYICLETRKKINVEDNVFKNCTIRKGSIIVTYTLVQRSDSMNRTLEFTANEMDANNFIITLPDGTTLKSQSLQVDGSEYRPKENNDSNESTIIAVVVSVLLIAIIIVIIIIVFLIYKNKSKQKVDPTPNGSYAQMEDNNQGNTDATAQQFTNPTYNDQ